MVSRHIGQYWSPLAIMWFGLRFLCLGPNIQLINRLPSISFISHHPPTASNMQRNRVQFSCKIALYYNKPKCKLPCHARPIVIAHPLFKPESILWWCRLRIDARVVKKGANIAEGLILFLAKTKYRAACWNDCQSVNKIPTACRIDLGGNKLSKFGSDFITRAQSLCAMEIEGPLKHNWYWYRM